MTLRFAQQCMQGVFRMLFGEPARIESTFAVGDLWGFSFFIEPGATQLNQPQHRQMVSQEQLAH